MGDIEQTLKLIKDRLNTFLKQRQEFPSNEEWVILSNIVDHSNQLYDEAKDKMVMFLANIQHETIISTYNRNVPLDGNQYALVSPPLYINQRVESEQPDKHFIFTDREFLPLISAQYIVQQLEGVKKVRALDISQQAVICKPRCFPVALAKVMNTSDINCKDVDAYMNSQGTRQDRSEIFCADVLYLNFSQLPEDKYTIENIYSSGEDFEAKPELSQRRCDSVWDV